MWCPWLQHGGPVAAVSHAVWVVAIAVLYDFCWCRVRLCARSKHTTAGSTVLAQKLASYPFADWLSVTGPLLHHCGISPLFYFTYVAQLSAWLCWGPLTLCTLSPKVCKILLCSSKKKKVHYIFPPPLMSTLSQSFDCMSQLKHLMLYLNIADLNEPLSSVREAPSA